MKGSDRTQRVFAVLRQAILQRILKPGDHLVEENIAQQLGVSRVPVREAIARLQAKYLISQQQNGRSVVRNFTLEDINEILFVRRVLETAAIELASAAPDDTREGNLKVLHALLDREACELSVLRPSEQYALNLDFHLTLVELGGNRHLKQTLLAILDLIQIALAASPHRPDNLKRSHEQHRQLLEAVENRNVEKAGKILTNHISATNENIAGTMANGHLGGAPSLQALAAELEELHETH
jgi:DNA-binding GntR family transcriptional regulator